MSRAFLIKNANNDEFYFVLRDDNNEIILRSSETYTTKQGCQKGIESVRVHASNDSNYTRYNDGSGKPAFRLLAINHQVIGLGESYNSTAGRDKGIENVKQCAPHAPVIDET